MNSGGKRRRSQILSSNCSRVKVHPHTRAHTLTHTRTHTHTLSLSLSLPLSLSLALSLTHTHTHTHTHTLQTHKPPIPHNHTPTHQHPHTTNKTHTHTELSEVYQRLADTRYREIIEDTVFEDRFDVQTWAAYPFAARHAALNDPAVFESVKGLDLFG